MAWRTYRLTVVAVIYALFVPAACITEGIPCCQQTGEGRKLKFFLSIILWFFMLALAIAAVMVAESSDQVQEIRTMVIVATSVASGIVLAAAAAVSARIRSKEERANGFKASMRAFKPYKPTWSHIMALLTAPLESVQLGAIGMCLIHANFLKLLNVLTSRYC